MREVYLDNSATTRTDPEIAALAADVMTREFGNPSSLHKKGLEAELLLEQARSKLASVLGCDPGEIYFTSGGTEANNLSLLGAFAAHKRRATGLISLATEHSSVLQPLKYLENNGGQLKLFSPLPDGSLTPGEVAGAIGADTLLLSLGLVNSEIGGVLPVSEISRAAKAKNPHILIHCDAVQAFGRLPVSVSKLGVDLLSISGHKFHAPKGIGALYIRRGIRITPLLYGGGQQGKVRPGTENVPLAYALGVAAEKLAADIPRNLEIYLRLRRFFLENAENIPELCINSASEQTPYICNISLPGFNSETLIHFLAGHGIYVSGGAACAKGRQSHVLAALGLSRALINSALRISFCKDTTEQDITDFFAVLGQAITTLVRSKP